MKTLERLEKTRAENKFKFHVNTPESDSANDPISDTKNYFLLGTDTHYEMCKELDNYPRGETLSNLYFSMPGSVIVDGAITHAEFNLRKLGYHTANRIAAHTTGLILTDIVKGNVKINISGHSRGGIEALLIAHELDRIKNKLSAAKRLDGESDKVYASRVKKIIANSIRKTTADILTDEIAILDDTKIIQLVNNIKSVRLKMYLLDPVPGNFRLDHKQWQDPRICKDKYFEIPTIVEKIHVQYAQDERSFGFDPAILKTISKDTMFTADSNPGHHGSVSGVLHDRQTRDHHDNSTLKSLERRIKILNAKTSTSDSNKKKLLDYWLKNNLGKKYTDYLINKINNKYNIQNNCFIEYSKLVLINIANDLSLIQEITAFNIRDFFDSNDSSNNISITSALSRADLDKLSKYNILSLIRQSHFQKFRKSYYDVIYWFSSNNNKLGRQARLGIDTCTLQKHVWLPSDDSKYVNYEHMILALRKKLTKAIVPDNNTPESDSTTNSSEPQETDLASINPDIVTIVKVIACIIKVTKDAEARVNKVTTNHILDPLSEQHQQELKALISEKLFNIVNSNDYQAMESLIFLTSKLRKLSGVKKLLFKETLADIIETPDLNNSQDLKHLTRFNYDKLSINNINNLLFENSSVNLNIPQHTIYFINKLIKTSIDTTYSRYAKNILNRLSHLNKKFIKTCAQGYNNNKAVALQLQRTQIQISNMDFILNHNLNFDGKQLGYIIKRFSNIENLLTSKLSQLNQQDYLNNDERNLKDSILTTIKSIKTTAKLYNIQKNTDDSLAALKKSESEISTIKNKLNKIFIINKQAIRIGCTIGLAVTATVGTSLLIYFVSPIIAPVIIAKATIAKATISLLASQHLLTVAITSLLGKILGLAVSAYNYMHLNIIMQPIINIVNVSILAITKTLANITLFGDTSIKAVGAKSLLLSSAAGVTAGFISKESFEAIKSESLDSENNTFMSYSV